MEPDHGLILIKLDKQSCPISNIHIYLLSILNVALKFDKGPFTFAGSPVSTEPDEFFVLKLIQDSTKCSSTHFLTM